MKLKNYAKYKKFIILSGCIMALTCSFHYFNNIHIDIPNSSKGYNHLEKLPVAYSTEDNNPQKNHNRIIIVPSDRSTVPDENMKETTNKTRLPIPAAGDALKVKPLPPADNNSRIIVNQLTSD